MQAPMDYYRFDEQTYMKGDELPELGSITCIRIKDGKRDYEGKIEDELLLDNITYAPDGSEATLYDGTDVIMKHSLKGVWYNWG